MSNRPHALGLPRAQVPAGDTHTFANVLGEDLTTQDRRRVPSNSNALESYLFSGTVVYHVVEVRRARAPSRAGTPGCAATVRPSAGATRRHSRQTRLHESQLASLRLRVAGGHRRAHLVGLGRPPGRTETGCDRVWVGRTPTSSYPPRSGERRQTQRVHVHEAGNPRRRRDREGREPRPVAPRTPPPGRAPWLLVAIYWAHSVIRLRDTTVYSERRMPLVRLCVRP
jgi:hypothetical protein